MQKANIKASNFLYMFGGIFLFVSTIFIIAVIAIGYPTIKTKINSDTYTMATRVEINSHLSHLSDSRISTMYSPVFYYNVNNKEYSCSTNGSSSIKPNLTNNKVYYNSKNPENCISEYDFVQNIIFTSIFLVIAIPMFVIGLFVFTIAIKQNNNCKRLVQNGKLIKDIPCRIIPSNITYNNKKGYIIEIEYEGLKLKSEAKFDIDVRRNTVDLLIDPLDTKNYFIDFDMT